ncbi:Rieske 2Fe-2S domain-containing protein [Plesiomonas shigelloides subsp. oncorhynchi]|nr:Rieske 2Fe-2S domain-containing protein [Plesiomonas shigelloides]
MCPCHGSKFDMAGRVFQGVPAPLNLMIPPYKFVDDNTILIGVDDNGVAA